jgi:hypothetical protein
MRSAGPAWASALVEAKVAMANVSERNFMVQVLA